MTPQQEQDVAAGGSHLRDLVLDDGTVARASMGILVSKSGKRAYAYLRFKVRGTNIKRYVGCVAGDSRLDRLRSVWKMAKRNRVIEKSGWSWRAPSRTSRVGATALGALNR